MSERIRRVSGDARSVRPVFLFVPLRLVQPDSDPHEDAGCDNDEILNHCRGPGPHVRGCWVVELVLATNCRGSSSPVNGSFKVPIKNNRLAFILGQ